MPKLWIPNNQANRGLIAFARRVRIRPRIPPRPRLGVAYEPQYLHWQVLNPDGSVAQEGEQHNLLLNGYKDLVATYGFVSDQVGRGLARYAVVGTGSSVPNPVQTGLDAELARTANSPGGDTIIEVSNGVYDLKYVREFPAGTFNDAALSEWGFSPSGNTGGPLMSRELFRDPSGNPIAVNVSSTQKLRFYYYVRITLQPVTPTAASLTISGVGTLTGLAYLQSSSYQDPQYRLSILALADMIAAGKTYGYYTWAGQYDTWYRYVGVHLWDRDPPAAFLNGDFGLYGSQVTIGGYTLSGYSRSTNPVAFDPTKANFSIHAISLSLYKPYLSAAPYKRYHGGFIFLIDPGQEFTKDNLHTLTIDSFTMSW